MFLLTDVLPVQAESLASPLNAIGDFLSFKPTLLIVEYTLP
jgi:hypothetical protein